MNQNQLQQGDVCLQRISALPEDVTPLKTLVVMEGEGHHHHAFAIAADVELFEKDGVKFARVKTATPLQHTTLDGRRGEHNPVTVAPGVWKITPVQEYDYLAEMARAVID